MMASNSAVLPSADNMSDSILNKTRPEFLRIVSPSRKTLESLEAKLIAGVLDDCIQQMGIVSLLPTLLKCPETCSLSLGEDVVEALKQHRALEERYRAMMLDGDPDEAERATTTKEVQDSFRNLLRCLRKILTTEEMFKEVRADTGEETTSQKLKDGLCELREVVLERLLTSSAEEQACSLMIQEASQRHSINQKLIDSLDKELAMAIKDRDTEVSKLTKKLQELESSLHQMEKSLEEFVVRTQQEAEKQNQSEKKTSEGKRVHVQQEANQMKAHLNNVIVENRERELALRKKKYKVETEIENLIQKYDAEMGEKQTELEEMTRVYEEEKAELKELEEHFAVLDLEYSQIMEERLQAEERREQEERERELHSRAVTIIQAHWRGFCVRRVLKTKTKPKKAKKGKGRKGK